MDTRSNPNLFVLNIEPEEEDLEEESLVLYSHFLILRVWKILILLSRVAVGSHFCYMIR